MSADAGIAPLGKYVLQLLALIVNCMQQAFGEIAFCAVSANEQVKGFGSRLMSYTKVIIHLFGPAVGRATSCSCLLMIVQHVQGNLRIKQTMQCNFII